MAVITRAVTAGQLSRSGADQVIRLAWTLADLAGEDQPGASECGQALGYYLGTSR